MNTSEFRIGNLMQDELTGSLLRIIELTEDNVVTHVIDRSKFPLPDGWKMVPIQVTCDWLLKFGFVKDVFNSFNLSISPWPKDHLKQLSFSGDYIFLREGNLKDSRHEDSIVTLWNNDVKGLISIHQLQNLYYSLTGTELKLSI